MRVALISDVHANLQAWNAVLLDIRTLKVDAILCLGDVIGYGPDPAAVMESLYVNVNHFALGNHDAALAGRLSDALFNDHARKSLAWTRSRLSPSAVDILKQFPLTLTGKGFRCAHGDFSAPEMFNYILEPDEALPSWQATSEPLLFVGHSHQPGIFLIGQSGTSYRVDPQDFELENGKRYLVNVGSVGNPRQGYPLATYCIHDTEKATVHWRSIPFDLDAFRDALWRAGLDDSNSLFLHNDPRLKHLPLRPQLGFRPSLNGEDGVKGAAPVQDISSFKRQTRLWRRITMGIAFLCVLILALTFFVLHTQSLQRPIHIDDPQITTRDGTSGPINENLLQPFSEQPLDPQHPLPGWFLTLDNGAKQTASLNGSSSGEALLRLTSQSHNHEIHLASPPIIVAPGQRFFLKTRCRKRPDFSGTLAFSISLDRKGNGKNEHLDSYVVKEPGTPRPDGWSEVQKTFTLPNGSTMIQVHCRGRFTGSIELPSIILYRRPDR